MGQFSQLARLGAAPPPVLLPHLEYREANHVCEARLRATCAACEQEYLFCWASHREVKEIVEQTWWCPSCC